MSKSERANHMTIILEQLLILYLFLFLGWFFGKCHPEQTSHTGILSFLLVNLLLPCKVFNTFAQNFTVDYITNNGLTILVSVSLLLFLAILSKFVAPLLTKNDYLKKVYRYSLTISNYAYMGYALMESLFGAQGLTDLIIFCIPFAMYTYTFGYSMLTGKGTSLKRIFNPLTCSILFGIVFGLFQIPLPGLISSVLGSSSSCVGPISMLLTGFSLSIFSIREIVADKTTYLVVFLRLAVIPMIVFVLCKSLGLTELMLPAVFMACMPCGLNTIVFPRLIGEDFTTGARLAFLSHLFSCATIPVWISILM